MQSFIVQVKVTSEMQERAESLVSHCIDAGAIVGNFLDGETAKVVNSWEVVKEEVTRD